MQIDRIYYPVKTLGYGNRIGIWTIGCPHRCKNCSNPELWEPDSAKDIPVLKLVEYIKAIPHADGITITGGDPFYQLEQLNQVVISIKELGYDDILIYSGYTINEIRKMGDTAVYILENIAILVDGKYMEELDNGLSFRGSVNQVIHRLNAELSERYLDAEHWERQSQIVINDNHVQLLGIPMNE